jgi:hypothetical protein
LDDGSSLAQQGQGGQGVAVEHAAEGTAAFGGRGLRSGIAVGVEEGVQEGVEAGLDVGACDEVAEGVECVLGFWVHDTRVLAESEARCQVRLSLVWHGIQVHCKKSGVAGVIQLRSGKIYNGLSGSRDLLDDVPVAAGKIHPEIRDLYKICGDVLSPTNGQCAEAKALSRALYDGNTIDDLRGAVSSAVVITGNRSRSDFLRPIAACEGNCQPVLTFLGIRWIR